MPKPKITVLLCTVRPDFGYVEHPKWHTIGKVVEDLSRQTLPADMFELIVVDGVPRIEQNGAPTPNYGDLHVGSAMPTSGACLVGLFYRVRIPPKQNLWTRNKKVAISAYRNTGIAVARGELIVNLDDCCELPPDYLEHFWSAWSRHKACISPLWRASGDQRVEGKVRPIDQDGETRPNPGVYGFGSYPREVALSINGYSEAYDGGQALEDYDFSTRLLNAGVRMALVNISGFKIHPQSAHDPRVVDNGKAAIVKCCNRAWSLERKMRHTLKANVCYTRKDLDFLVKPPCPLFQDGKCAHHNFQHDCAYPEIAQVGHPVADQIYDEVDTLVFDLRGEAEDCR